jgi:hypothetical protein
VPSGLQQTEEAGAVAGPQVVAQGISRLPRGEIAWTVRRIDVPGGDGIPVEEFVLGFGLADGGAVAVLNQDEDVLALLGDGEADFLPSGRPGALRAQDAGGAALYEIALVSAEQLAAGETTANVAGGVFAAPAGGRLEIELSRGAVGQGAETALPVARSGAPALFLLTSGAARLISANGQSVELAAGQNVLLQGEVVAQGTSAEPAVFVVAAIGEAVGGRASADGTPEARAGRDRGQRARDRRAGDGEVRRARQRGQRERRGGRRGGQTQGPGTSAGGGAPIAGGAPTALPQETAGTPAPQPTLAATPPPVTEAPTDGTPPPAATEVPIDGAATPPATEVPTETSPTPEPTVPPDEPEEPDEEEVTPDDPVPATETPIPEEPPAEPTVPPVEEQPTEIPAEEPPAEEPPAEEPPAEEETVAAESIVEAPVEEAPIEIVEEPAPEETPAG